MSIALYRWPLVPAALAGLLSWMCDAGPAAATEAATPLASPAARYGETESCRIVFPRFEPMSHGRTAPDAAKAVGGAKLHSLVAIPCRQAAHVFDI